MTDRLPYLQKGLVAQLAQLTNGIAVVLEHRYYGASIPTKDFSTESLRFLTTEQGLADVAYFAQNIVYPGFEDQNLTSRHVPYIAYGGSYAGAMVAFLRVTYPDVFFGAIASSAVTEAIVDYWQYWEPIRRNAPQNCIHTVENLTGVLDNLAHNTSAVKDLETLFGLQDLSHVDDFANVLSYPLSSWQGRNWDPAVNDPTFFEYCVNITVADTLLYNDTSSSEDIEKAAELVALAGWDDPKVNRHLTTQLLNFAGYLNETVVWPCIGNGRSADDCFSSYNTTFYEQNDLTQNWRLWEYQVCTEWGFFQTGSGTPKSKPSLVSRLVTLDYTSLPCKYAFNITTPPEVDARINNKYGGFNISYPRLAFIGGTADPWREATPFANDAPHPHRPNTLDRPFAEIEGGVHHWDENGLFPNETTEFLPPKPVENIQAYEHEFVKAWLSTQKWAHLAREEQGFFFGLI
ncbi:extracelular serine carboxypeptidase, putative [Talaromyces stipitatus ATCC 10500]|uniref:Extracelular serine carboxypeptidase, putative n=1 Tax=Talaromyces stipitatus (strain ATCC 10500 / CBS 375.48 / QM 6759 / NRRL 1006) TaxID=441959 RepID=B8MC46_TALSN|nr:extracelular serine carboxypeptidase, putative [Talaromyces stipitatus ATCC 10500]EED18492.1 extracelular serine carboxypeptidase, putative [Talaromyces stipitatus ATCC 10500]